MNSKQIIILIMIALSVTACARLSGGIAPSNIPVEPGSYQVLGDARGQDCTYYLLGLIPLQGKNTTSKAMDFALEPYPEAEALVGITSDTFSQYFILFSRACITVEGQAIVINASTIESSE